MTMGPESAVRALHKAVSLGADRSVHLTDEALAGSDVAATGYALAKALEQRVARPRPARPAVRRRRVLHDRRRRGRPPADAVADPGDQDRRRRTASCAASARPSTATTPSQVELPAVISVGDAINEPRYPSLKAIMGAKKKPLDTQSAGDVGIDGSQGRRRRLPGRVRQLPRPAAEGGRPDHRGRGHQRDGREDRRLARGKEAARRWRHPGLRPPLRGRVQQELPRRRLRGRQARRRARRRGPCRRRRRRRPDRRACAASLGNYGATKVFRAKGARGPRPAGRRRDGQGHRATTVTATRCSAAACSASRSAPAWPRA